ncbi:MAG: tyrosine-type recombinase/integrase [Cyclobacteriaceae bacterium]|nr:tyrosine-type recombinase/integrase [Cyclobacteriaceae bacterium]
MTDLFLKYLQYEKRYSHHTILSYKTDLDQFQHFLIAQYPETAIAEANHAIIRDWIISLSQSSLSENSINRKLVSLRSFYKFLQKKGEIAKNPTARLTNLKTKKSLPHFVREGDLNQVLDQPLEVHAFAQCRDLLVVEILYGTGMRLSELISLKISDIDLTTTTLKVLGKRNKERLIPISRTLANLIQNYIFIKNQDAIGNGNPYLIVTNKGEQSYAMMINRIVKKTLQAASVDKKSPHILRHTYATHLLERGADLNAVKDLLGHQSLAATQVYTHNSLGKLKKVFDQAHPKA